MSGGYIFAGNNWKKRNRLWRGVKKKRSRGECVSGYCRGNRRRGEGYRPDFPLSWDEPAKQSETQDESGSFVKR